MKKLIFIYVCLLVLLAFPGYAAQKWAEIYRAKVVAIHQTPDNFAVVFSPRSLRFAVNVTAVNPQPQQGWVYDFETQQFSAPPITYNNPITSKAFYLRMTGAERESFISSIDPKVKQFAYWLGLSGDVNLIDQKVVAGTNYLETIGIIGVGRAAVILTAEEQ